MSVQATFAATLVDEWVHAGVTDAVICPGSRSTPLALALAARLRVHVRLDERSAGFFALGLAMATERPAIVCTTSGTAVAELHPALVEAHHGRVPLLACTADRPPELHHVGAPQTIEQAGIFPGITRWAYDPGVADDSDPRLWRRWASRAYAEATQGPFGPGPVHLNLPFREPLVGEPGDLPGGDRPVVSSLAAGGPHITTPLGGRGVIVAGGRACGDPELVVQLGEALGWPVVADPRSRCRLPGTIAAADSIVRADVEGPETVVLLGAPWLSKALGAYIERAAGSGARVVAVDPWWQWVDPSNIVGEIHRAQPDAWLRSALQGVIACDVEWLREWRGREAEAQKAIDAVLGDLLCEPAVARRLFGLAAEESAVLMASASMPMRDLEWYAPAVERPPAVMANRGANGIDGVVSTALGLASTGRRTYALLGDLAFLHDVSGLVNLPDVPCTLVVVDNAGGGIFSFLPQAHAVEDRRFEQIFGTPPTSDVGEVARGFGLPVVDVTRMSELGEACRATPPVLVRVHVPDRRENVAIHERLHRAVAVAVS